MIRALVATCLVALAFAGCEHPSLPIGPPLEPDMDAELRRSLSRWGVLPIGPLPGQDPAMVELGRAIAFDKILSGNRDISCATCHHPRTHGTDGLPLSIGTGGTGIGPDRALGPGRELVPRNAPSFLNQALRSFYILWDGRVSGFRSGPFQSPPGITLPGGLPDILAAQAMLPVLDRREMRGEPGDTDVHGGPNELAQFGDGEHDAVWDAIMARLLAIPEYRAMFQAAYPATPEGALRFRHAAAAIAAFIADGFTKLDSPFDRFLAGDDRALGPEAKRGALFFFSGGWAPGGGGGEPLSLPPPTACASCHGGPLLGGETFANVAVPQLGPGTGAAAPLDLGRGEFVGAPSGKFQRFAFRAPPLRNVELTAPYMHNGAYATLEEVIRHYDNAELALRGYDASHLDPRLRAMVHDDDETIADVLSTMDFRLRIPLNLSEAEQRDLLAFLASLTDPSARDLSSVMPAAVPSGLPIP